jgi:hypothetical protein
MSTRCFNLFLPIWILLALSFPAHASYSLHQILNDAKTHNPNQQANELNVEAYKLDASAARKNALWPNLSVSSSEIRSDYNAGVPSTNSADVSILATETLYDGGAGRHGAKYLEWQAKAQEALYNSTNQYVEGTAGSVARKVFNYFLAWNYYRMMRNTAEATVTELGLMLPLIKDPNSLSEVRASLLANQIQLSKVERDMVSVKADLCHAAHTEDIPDDIDGLEKTNEMLKWDLFAFQNVNEAIRVAKTKNNDYLAKYYNLQAVIEQSMAVDARLKRPLVQFVVSESWNHTTTFSPLPPMGPTHGAYFGVQFSMPLSFGLSDTVKANQFRERAARQNVAQQEDEFTYAIKSAFLKLEDSDATLGKYADAVAANHREIVEFINDHVVKNSEVTKDDIAHLSALYTTYTASLNYYTQIIQDAVTMRYELEVSIGVLFESVALRVGNLATH